MSNERKLFVGLDNGVTGTIGTITQDYNNSIIAYYFGKVPTKITPYKTKEIKRINKNALKNMINSYHCDKIYIAIENPLMNSKRFSSTMSAMRALEATEIAIEELDTKPISIEYIPALWWQDIFLTDVTGKDLKSESYMVGISLFPKIIDYHDHDDCDGILIAEWLRRKTNGNL